MLLSEVTSGLVRDDLPPGAALRDMGRHRLRDLQRPEQLFQLVHPDLPSDFPPLRSLDTVPNNLPQQLTSFIGRERELAETRELLIHARPLTLVGPGGTGKSRLSLQLAAEVLAEHPGGVWQVELAPLADAELIPQAVASALEVREEPARPLPASIAAALQGKKVLLLLDNCEHLLGGAAHLAAALLRSCPLLTVIATSREALNIAGETIYRLAPLSLPPPVEGGRLNIDGVDRPDSGTINHQPPPATRSPALKQYESVRLFVDRAAAVSPSFALTEQNAAAVARICRQLDGIPLAIELAAARVRALAPEKIASRLDDRFRLLTGGSRTMLPHQQTLRALIDWSYDLLIGEERTVLQSLSVFHGGWTLESAEQVCGDDGQQTRDHGPQPEPVVRRPSSVVDRGDVLDLLTSLVDKSLVLYDEGEDEPQYRLLETVRQYSRERLRESGGEPAARERHAQTFLHLAEEAAPHLAGGDQQEWLSRLSRVEDDLWAALGWALGEEPAPATVAATPTEAQQIASVGSETVTGSFNVQPSTLNRPEGALRLAGALWRFWSIRGELSAGRRALDEALARVPAGHPTLGRTRWRAQALAGAGALAHDQADCGPAGGHVEESLALWRELGDAGEQASCLNMLANLAFDAGDHARADSLYEEALARYAS